MEGSPSIQIISYERDKDMDAPFLEVHDICKQFGEVKVLKSISLAMRKGEIQCLAGENGCGKSTLIKIISGYYHKDSGDIIIENHKVDSMTSKYAISKGIQVVYQDLSLYPSLSIAENIVLASQIQEKKHFVKWKDVRKQAQEALKKIEVDVDVNQIVSSLPVAKKQLVSIAKALYQDAKLVILDEPTTSLTEREIDILFSVLQNLANKGMSILLVSHKLREVLRISTRLTIMRNGSMVISGETKDFTETSISKYMTGREVEKQSRKIQFSQDEKPFIEIKNLSRQGSFHDVSMSFRPGEIVGITGLLGSGRAEVVKSIIGLETFDSGTLLVDGKPCRFDSISQAIAAKIGYVTDERISEGSFSDQPVRLNMISASLPKFTKNLIGTMDEPLVKKEVASATKQFNIIMKDQEMFIKYLSGGNAQKVMLARWLLANVRILFHNGPTVGVDIEIGRASCRERV